MCFGADAQCNDADACSTSYYSYCAGAASTASSPYVKQTFIEVLEIQGADGAYLTDSNLIATHDAVSSGALHANMPNGHIDVNLNIASTSGSPQYTGATVERGNWFAVDDASVPTKGFWVSAAFMLLKSVTPSTATLQSNKINVAYCNTPTCTHPAGWTGCDTNGEACGHDVCMSTAGSNDNPPACGANISYTPGDLKFSMFGMLAGSTPTVAANVNYIAVRTNWEIVNYPANHVLTFNGGTSLANLGTTDVTSISVTNEPSGTETVSITFQPKYNYGSNGHSSQSATLTPGGAKNVKIKAKADGTNKFYVDYLFDAADLKAAGKWWLYDPKVTAVTPSPTPSQTSSGERQVASGIITMMFTVAYSMM
jgi:hypothetical protein